MGNLIVTAILIIIFGLSIAKIVSEKRKGVKCIGCPHGGSSKKVSQINLSPNHTDCSCNK